jgi:hypothetical protein
LLVSALTPERHEDQRVAVKLGALETGGVQRTVAPWPAAVRVEDQTSRLTATTVPLWTGGAHAGPVVGARRQALDLALLQDSQSRLSRHAELLLLLTCTTPWRRTQAADDSRRDGRPEPLYTGPKQAASRPPTPTAHTRASSSVSRLRATTRVVQALLRALELPFELLQSSVRANTPSVQLRSQQRDTVAVVVRLGLQLLDLIARAHASNSTIEDALCGRTSRTPSRQPGSSRHETANGRCGRISRLAITVPPQQRVGPADLGDAVNAHRSAYTENRRAGARRRGIQHQRDTSDQRHSRRPLMQHPA